MNVECAKPTGTGNGMYQRIGRISFC